MIEPKFIAISGGMDPVHGGQIDYIDEASTHGKVIIFLNTDAWLMRKKGYVFMKWHERAKILRAMTNVFEVVPADDEDDTVCASIEKYKPDLFGKGGDRTKENTPELAICTKFGIPVIFGLGGDKSNSSSELVANVRKS